MRADAILDRQVELVSWMKTTQASDFFTRYAESMMSTYGVGSDELVYPAVTNTVFAGEPYYVTGDVKDLLIAASQKLPFDAVLKDFVVPSPAGFIQLERPYLIKDINGNEFEVWALGWCRAMFNHAEPGTAPTGIVFTAWTHPYKELGFHTPYDLFWVTPWSSSTIISVEGVMEQYPERTAEEILEAQGETLGLIKFLATFFAFVNQKVPAITNTREHSSRPARRRLERSRLVIEPSVQVIELRRRESHSSDEKGMSAVQWSHRWIVDGHWRRQYYPSTDSHEMLWISEYVKGPEDLPLVVRDKLYKVAR